MTDEIDREIAKRLEVLANAAPVRQGLAPQPHTSKIVTGITLLAGGTVALIATVALIGGIRAVDPGLPGASPSSTPDASLPAGGISQEAAIAAAWEHAPRDGVLVGVTSGTFETVNTLPGIGPGHPIAPDRLVWGVKFESTFEICPPNGSPCWSPRPGWTTVIVDFKTGEVLSTQGFSP
jgi:hypothetical protein